MNNPDIISALPPPEKPVDLPAFGDWEKVEARLGVKLPDDYKFFIEKYGTGAIDNFLWILSPVSSNPNLNIEEQVKTQAEVLKDLESYGERIPYPPFPKSGGILPFAISDNGDVIYWRTDGVPQQWTVVLNAARSPAWEQFNLTMTDFLTKICLRQLSCEIFPDDFPRDKPEFFPA